MRRRRKRDLLSRIMLTVTLVGLARPARPDPPHHTAADQTGSSQPAKTSPTSETVGAQDLPSTPALDSPATSQPPAARSPDGAGARVPSAGEEKPAGLPINLATALQLAGVNPLDIAAATVQVQQGLALLLQAKVLWIPNLNAGRRLLPPRRRSAEHLHGCDFPEGKTDLFRRRRAQPERRAHRCDLRAAGGATGGRRARGRSPDGAGTMSCCQSPRRSSTCRRRGGDWLGSTRRSCGPSCWSNLPRGWPRPDRSAGDQPGARPSSRACGRRADRDPRLAGRQRQSGGGPPARPGGLLEPIEPPFLQITLVPADQTAGELVPIALNNRPEIASQRELLAAADQRLRQEKKRPFLPNLDRH